MAYEYEELNTLLRVASEELRQRLNEVIANHKMRGETVLAMLARISAGYIHQMQRSYDQAGAEAVVEEDFQSMLKAFLTDMDMNEVKEEKEKKPGVEKWEVN